MAITKTRTVRDITVHPLADSSAADSANAKHPTLEIVYRYTFDDPNDNILPAMVEDTITISRYVEDGGSATDYSGEEALVRTVAAAIWT